MANNKNLIKNVARVATVAGGAALFALLYNQGLNYPSDNYLAKTPKNPTSISTPEKETSDYETPKEKKKETTNYETPKQVKKESHPTYAQFGKYAGTFEERMKKVKPLYAYTKERIKSEEEFYKEHHHH